MKRFFFKSKMRSNASIDERLSDKNINRDKRCLLPDFEENNNGLLPANAKESSNCHEYELLMSQSVQTREQFQKLTTPNLSNNEMEKHKMQNTEELPKQSANLKTDHDNYIVYGICNNLKRHTNNVSNTINSHKQNHENRLPERQSSIVNQCTNSTKQTDAISIVSNVSNAEIPQSQYQSCTSSSNIVSILASCCIPANTNTGQMSPDIVLHSENGITYTTIAFEPTSSKSSLIDNNSTADVKTALLNCNTLPVDFLTKYKVFGNRDNATVNCSEILSMHELFCNCSPSCCCHCQSPFVPNISECLACFHTVCGQLSDAHYCKLGSYEHVYPSGEGQNVSAGNTVGAGDTATRSDNAVSQNRTNVQNTTVYSRDMVSD